MEKTLLNPLSLFGHLPDAAPVGLAVSGGSDSMALLHLFALYRESCPLPDGMRDVVLTVDHGLRPEAADEVAFVTGRASELGFETVALKLQNLLDGHGLQARAREARYEAMSKALTARGLTRLLTAHTLDDQAETLLMRLKRGSGVDGLAGMAAERLLFSILLCRPLLAFSRDELRQFLRGLDVRWVEDPSNKNEIYERVSLRAALEQIDPERELRRGLSLSAQRLARSKAALDVWVESVLTQNAQICAGVVHFPLAAFSPLPTEIQLRVLGRIIAGFGRAVLLSKLEALLDELLFRIEQPLVCGAGSEDEHEEGANNRGRGFTHALAGVLVDWQPKLDALCFYREWQRAPFEEITIQPDELPCCPLWDGRLALNISGKAPQPLTLRAFKDDERRDVMAVVKNADTGKILPEGVMPEALSVNEAAIGGLVGVWCGQRVVAVPQLSRGFENLVMNALNNTEESAGLECHLSIICTAPLMGWI